jgi:hypothetical protein
MIDHLTAEIAEYAEKIRNSPVPPVTSVVKFFLCALGVLCG